MASDDQPGSYADDLARLDKATAKVKRARAELAKAEAEATAAVAAALRSAVAEGRNRTEVQQHSPFSPPTVRKIGDAAGVPPDERYVRTAKPEAADKRHLGFGETGVGDTMEEAIANAGPIDYGDDLRAAVVAAGPRRIAELVDQLRRDHAAWYRTIQEPAAAGASGNVSVEIVVHALADGLLTLDDLAADHG